MSKLFSIILTIVLSLPICVWAVDNTTDISEPAPIVNTLDEDVDLETQEEKVSLYKQPVSKRKIAKKFLLAMGGVATSSLAIFFLLTVYNRIRENCICQFKTQGGENSLETPDDLDSAIKCFLDKTNWKGS